MPVTLYGINDKGQPFRSYVVPEEVDYYVKEKGLSTEPIKVPKVVEKEVEKKEEVIEKPKNGKSKKEKVTGKTYE